MLGPTEATVPQAGGADTPFCPQTRQTQSSAWLQRSFEGAEGGAEPQDFDVGGRSVENRASRAGSPAWTAGSRHGSRQDNGKNRATEAHQTSLTRTSPRAQATRGPGGEAGGAQGQGSTRATDARTRHPGQRLCVVPDARNAEPTPGDERETVL